MGRQISRSFFERSAVVVAPEIIGCELRVGPCAVRINEVEAYTEDDEASHSFRGRTNRNVSMFGRPGHSYVYLCYGMHWCFNVVTGPVGQGEAVLIRGGIVSDGEAEMFVRRPKAQRVDDLTNGPGKLTAALGINRSDDGVDLLLTGSPISIRLGTAVTASHIERSPRIGISKAKDRLWRFSVPAASVRSVPVS